MSGRREWYLVCYDIRDAARWRKAYKLIKGYGQRIQYSIFRCRLSKPSVEELRWELTQALADEDSILHFDYPTVQHVY
ncbi:MAG: CRISPR-associated endonuclease Cas2 [Candidatus Obscuribacterales bacterium]|nr:CRISPR-associated endonuclease Cas2 [Candidatus Obscuribacterales bacterium]